jgi:predicted esterase
MTMNETHIIETKTHGRYLVSRGAGQRLLVGFHGYAENAEMHLAELEKLGIDWTLVAVQALHPFYTRTQEVVANWMTRQDREHAIADNIDYVRRVVGELGPLETLVFAGFSQGTAMAYRAAAAIGCHGVIALAGDLPPDVTGLTVPVLIGRGESDEWYTSEKLNKDLSFLPNATACVFPGGHEWTEPFREAAGRFLGRMS